MYAEVLHLAQQSGEGMREWFLIKVLKAKIFLGSLIRKHSDDLQEINEVTAETNSDIRRLRELEGNE